MDGGGEGGAFGLGDDAETLGQSLDFVAVAHPDLVLLARRPKAIEEGAFVPDLDEGTAEFGMIAIDDLAAPSLGPQLLAIADAKHRHPPLDKEDRQRAVLGKRVSDRVSHGGRRRLNKTNQ